MPPGRSLELITGFNTKRETPCTATAPASLAFDGGAPKPLNAYPP